MLWPAQMKQQDKCAFCRLCIFAPAADDRTACPRWIIINLTKINLHEFSKLELLSNKLPFRDKQMILAPSYIATCSRLRYGRRLLNCCSFVAQRQFSRS